MLIRKPDAQGVLKTHRAITQVNSLLESKGPSKSKDKEQTKTSTPTTEPDGFNHEPHPSVQISVNPWAATNDALHGSAEEIDSQT